MAAVNTFARQFALAITADGSGAAAVIIEDFAMTRKPSGGPRRLYGKIFKVAYTPDPVTPFTPGFSLNLTIESNGEAVLQLGGIPAGPQAWYPISPMQDARNASEDLRNSIDADGNTTFQENEIYCHGDRIRCAVAGAGAGGKGTVTVYIG
jgi:hypothetical protein